MEPVLPVDQRLRKLLLYVGEEGKQFETRDIKHLSTSVESIIQKHLKLESDLTPLIFLITKCIISIPNKSHLYALMTGQLSNKYQDKMGELINCVLIELQSSLNLFKQNLILNIFEYLSELLNFNILNSFIFISLLESLLAEAKKSEGKQKIFYLRIILKNLPFCWKSLDQKMSQDFKKIMQKIDKEANHLPKSLEQFWTRFYQQYSNKKLKDHSSGEHLRTEQTSQQQKQEFKQFHPTFKLSFKDKNGQAPEYVEVDLQIQENDILYRQFLQSIEAFIHKQNVVKICESYFKVKLLFVQKLKDYLKKNENSFLTRLLMETLWKEVFRRPFQQAVVFASVFSKLGTDADQELRTDYKRAISDTALQVFSHAQTFNLQWTEKLINVLSFYFANVETAWEWSQWIDQQNLVNRHVILQLVFEKLGMLSEYKAPPQASAFVLSKAQPTVLDSKQSLFEARIKDKFDLKADSDQVIPLISNPGQFTIFLQLLLGKMSNSMTHLQKLSDRYKSVFLHFNYQRQTITCIHDFWEHSQFHKILYFIIFLQKQMITFQKFVEGISMKAKLSNSIEKILLRRVYQQVKMRTNEAIPSEALHTDLQQSLAF